jgi:hypothetical protein
MKEMSKMYDYPQDREVARFLEKYEARAGLSHQHYRRRRNVRFNYSEITTAIDYLKEQPWEEEAYVEMLIPQDRFRHLVEMEEYNTRREEEYQWAKHEQDRQRRERWIRQKNPSVQMAWDRYQMLLALVDDGRT